MTPEEVVRAELAAMASLDVDQIMSYFAADAVLDVVPYGPVLGHDAVRKAVEGYATHMTRCDVEILNLAVAGNVVLTERIDHLIFDGTATDARCMGAFEVSGDKITAWRDYFDSAERT